MQGLRAQQPPALNVWIGHFKDAADVVWDRSGSAAGNWRARTLLTHRKLRIFGGFESGAEHVDVGETLHVLVTPIGCITVLIGKDFIDAHASVESLLTEVPVDWVLVPSFGDEKRYLYRGVIQERDILKCENGQVTYRFRDSETKKMMLRSVSGANFLWLVLQHVLPKGSCRARNFGFLHPNSKRLIALLKLLVFKHPAAPPTPPTPRPQLLCTCCGAPMVIVRRRILPPPPRSPPVHIAAPSTPPRADSGFIKFVWHAGFTLALCRTPGSPRHLMHCFVEPGVS